MRGEQTISATGDGEKEDDLFADAMRFVQDLHTLSSQLALDASDDDQIFGKAAESIDAGKHTS